MTGSSEEDEDEPDENEDRQFDYRNFFSVLMYYGHMSKEDIMNSSRAFLHGIYRMYVNRACENLGVSPKDKEDEQEENAQDRYPSEFMKLSKKERKEAAEEYDSTEDFLSQFGQFNLSQYGDSSLYIAKSE